jgi:putative PEP-CTERM system TPR-repeat lipoprotein
MRLIRLIGILALVATVACRGGADAPTHMAKGEALLRQGKTAEAVIEYRSAVRADNKNAEAQRGLARAYEAQGNTEAAAKALVRAADLLPNDLTAQLQASRALLRFNAFEDARDRAARALKIDPKSVDAHILRASATVGLKDTDVALSELEDTADLDKGRGDTLVNLGAVQTLAGRNEEAEASFKQAVVVAPQSIPAHLSLANFYWRTGRLDKAEQALNEALKVDPKNVQLHVSLYNLFLSSKRQAQAEAPLKAAVAASNNNGRLVLALADYYVASKRFEDARGLLQALEKDKITATAAGSRLAGVEYELGNRDAAHKHLDALIEKDPRNPQLLVLKGNWLLRERKGDAALEAATAALKLDANEWSAHSLAGETQLMLRKNPAEAERAYREVLRLKPNDVNARMALASIESARGKSSESLTLAREAVQSAPTSGAARMTLARTLLKAGDVRQAMSELKLVLDSAPNAPEPLTLLGEIQQREGNDAAARESFSKALQSDPRNTQALVALVNLEIRTGRGKDAVRRIEQQMAAGQPDARLLLIAGRTSAATGDLARAESLYRKAIETDPSQMAAYSALGELFIKQNKLDEAIAAYDSRLAKRADDVPALTMTGIMLLVKGKTSDARQRFERVLAVDPRAVVASNNLAYLDAEAGANLDIALNRAQTAKASSPDDPDIDDTLGWIFVKKGLPALAVSPLQEAIRKDGANALYHYHLGVARANAGDKDGARTSLAKALQLAPSFQNAADAKRMLATLGS